jgi:1-hydroxycarotenoid 3,4-desaturase
VAKAGVIIVGAGIAGLVAAVDLARQGLRVTLLERAAAPGGKMREIEVGGARIDAGPTVFTMRHVLDGLFADAGTALSDHVTLQRADILARHAWNGRERLDLFADIDRSAEAIGAFAGRAEAEGFRDFCARARGVFATLDGPFMHAARPTPLSLVKAAGLSGAGDLWRIAPFTTLWRALGAHFRDPRLRQLFGRYATYSGSSPFLAPATLMLIAHVEQDGVWLVEGGMHRLASALADLATAQGAVLRYDAEVRAITTAGGRATGVTLASGEHLDADAVVVNADIGALSAGLFGPAASRAVVAPGAAERSLSAITWSMTARTAGFPLVRHNVFFSDDYPGEFEDILTRRRLPAAPTVYVCAQDRDDRGAGAPEGTERLFCLVNAPPTGDAGEFTAAEIRQCEETTFAHLARCGLTVARHQEEMELTTPAMFNRLFPGSGGALYGRAMHGSMAAFRRPAAASKLAGLYLAGGGVHPGPGVPMAALSGRLAAARLLADCSASTGRSRATAMPGGMSMRSATTDSTASR